MHFQICGNNDGNIIHVFKNCISISVATVLEVSKMTVPICTSHWCLVMSFWLKVCIYSHTRGVKLGLGLGFMQTSQVLPHWLNQSFSFWTLSYTQRHCHVRIWHASERRLVVPSQRRSKSLSRTFSFTIPGWWNNLHTPIRNAGSLSIFKQQLKTHLFRHYLTSS